MEAELLDSQTNARVGAAIDERAGKKLKGVTKWGATKAAFKFWAERLRTWLDEIHGKE